MDRRWRAGCAGLLLALATATTTGCGGGGDLFAATLQERSAVLHAGETVTIDGVAVGYCKHAWLADPATGLLRRAVVIGRPLDTSSGSPWGTGRDYDYVRLDDVNVEPFRTDYGFYVRKVWVHPDEGVTAADEVHRASWIEISWYE